MARELLPYLTVVGPLLAAIWVALRFQRSDARQSVEISGLNLDQALRLRDEAVEAQDRCRAEKTALREGYDRLRTEKHTLEEALARASVLERECRDRVVRLERRIRQLGGDPGE